MSKTKIPDHLRELVLTDSKRQCGYCLAPEARTWGGLEIDHIVPESKNGQTSRENLWAACSPCNRAKSDNVEGTDPQTGQKERFFNPRTQAWPEHFQWSADGLEIEGRTATGRATVAALKFNKPLQVENRRNWINGPSWSQPHRE